MGKGDVFRMAPLHHHFELEDASERTVIAAMLPASGPGWYLVLLGLLHRPTL